MKILRYFFPLLFAVAAFAQQPACPFGSYPAPNDTSTGTTLNKLAKINSSGNAVLMATTDTGGYAGVAIQSAGTSGTVCLAVFGIWPVIMDATSTIQHYVTISGSVNGDGSDSGASTYPATGPVVGRVQTASTGAAGISLILLFPSEIQAGTPNPLILNGIIDGKAPVTITTGSSATVGAGTYNSGYTINQNATAATAITYTLPVAAAGKQYCVTNSYNGSAPTTGVITLATSAAGQFIIFTDGTLSATGGNVTSAGAAADAACVVGLDATHWQLYVNRGTWTKH